MKRQIVSCLTVSVFLMTMIVSNASAQQLVQTFTGEVSGNSFGCSVSDAGDVNGDGYADVIIGAYAYSTNTGRAYIYYGGGSMDATADVTMTGGTTSNYFGTSVSGAGDVNNDGFDDVIVGAYYYSSGKGRAYIYFGGGSMDNIADLTLDAESSGNNFGYSVSGAGDVNGDGYADVIVGASRYNTSYGRAYIYYGGGSMDATADVTMTGVSTTNYFGESVSGAGDVNNDGYDDVIVGAYGYSSNAGRAYIYYGGNSMDTGADVTLSGLSGSWFGDAVSGAGDVNKDGCADVIVGADKYPSGDANGRAYIYFGSGSMSSTIAVTSANVVMTGSSTNNYFGYSLSEAGDVNKDGYDDVIVGAYGYSDNIGQAYIFYGSSSMSSSIDASAADVTMDGTSSSKFGYSVSGAGDVNNDGYDDVIVGANNSSYGYAYIYSDNDATMVDESLPVSLTDFSAELSGNSVALAWRTESETENLGFIIERAVGAIHESPSEWSQIASYTTADALAGHGSTSEAHEYTWTDATVVPGAIYIYRLGDVDYSGKVTWHDAEEVTVPESGVSVPTEFGLQKAYPNPFNPAVTLSYSLTTDARTSLKVYNVLGQEVATLVNSYQNNGNYTYTWQPQNLSAGIYLVRLESGNKTNMQKVVFVK